VIALELGGPQHQEERIAVELELRPLVGVERVLDRQGMQPNWAWISLSSAWFGS
jgi:hypothetical protein